MWIHPRVEQTRRLALACGIDAGKEHDHGKLGVQQLLLRVEQLGTQDRNLSLVDFLFEFPSEFGRLEHPSAWYSNYQFPTPNYQPRTTPNAQLVVVGSWDLEVVGRWTLALVVEAQR